MSKMIRILQKHRLIISAIIVSMIILLLGSAAKIFIPFEIKHRGQIVITIEKGQSLISISHELEKEGIIDSPLLFRTLVTLRGSENSIPAGFYLFSDGKQKDSVSLNEVVRRLTVGDSGFKAQKITIPEGSNVIAMGEIIHKEIPSIDSMEFVSSARQYEGYLFPDTYFFMPYATTGEIITKMRTTFDQKTGTEAFKAAVLNSGHSMEDIVKMASILEGEVRTLEDRKIVSDLLWRRIENGMALQVDSTFSYINQKTSAELTLNDLKIDSLYNTYKYRGLPPTPISNPGIETLMSAAQPTPNQYVYFLNDKEGTSHFSKTYGEHLRYKNQYLR